MRFASLEVCAGGGGQALGLEKAGFHHVALVDNDRHACATLRLNRPYWNTIECDLEAFDARPYATARMPSGRTRRLDLLAGGVPCPPFSVAGKMLGAADERNLFHELIRLAEECRPRAVLIENVRGLLDSSFDAYRLQIEAAFLDLGYKVPGFKLLQASDFGVPQLRPRVVFVALRPRYADHFRWPSHGPKPPTVGQALYDLMAENGWAGVDEWSAGASTIAPTLVGGSKRHGGPDLGPTRARNAWAAIGVNGKVLANKPPTRGFRGRPSLTVQMAAVIQGFDPDWRFAGPKTHAYRQVGNAFPPPVAKAIAQKIGRAIALGGV
jgi:DNA (cytosine-5)-methyltransferase 1